MRKSNGVETLAIRRMIIVTAPADRRKTRRSIHADGRVTVPNFQMDARYCLVSGAFEEVIKQLAAHASAVMARQDGDQQELGFVGHGPKQGEADRLLVFS
jgi:hypothetical protein